MNIQMRDPDLNKLHIIPEQLILNSNTELLIWYIRPTGYLLGIAINPREYAELKCKLQSFYGDEIPDSEFHVGYAYTSGGIWLKEPLRNINAAYSYRLVIEKERDDSPPIPNLTIYPIGCWEKM